MPETTKTVPMRSLQIGRGVADITGEPWGAGMMGYGMPQQWTKGILSRQFARAFVFDDGFERLVYVVAEIGMFFQATVEAILVALARRFGARYDARNVVLTATHTHCGPGGYGHHTLYNITTKGFHARTFDRIVDGIVDAIALAHDDLAPATAILNRGQLTDASANRSQDAFDLNPADDREHFPGSVDPMTTLLRIEREGELVGAINWFAVHNTSMTNRNRLISADNKGVAALLWENEGAHPRCPEAELVTAFAQTNAGDISPNLELKPGKGPTDDDRKNTRIIGTRQYEAAKALSVGDGESLAPVLQSRMTYVNLARQVTADGPTGRAVLGASFAAGKLTDGPGSPLFDEGKNNPLFERLSSWIYRRHPETATRHSPKDLVLPVGPLHWIAETYPIQLVRLGSLYLICLPIEVTIVSALRMRRAISDILATDLDHVLVQGYANGYGHYVTTPEEYEFQNYEGGSTIFGRHELSALIASVSELAIAMREGKTVDRGVPPRAHRFRIPSPTGSPQLETKQAITVTAAPSTAAVGDIVRATFRADHPNAVIRPTYLLVERESREGWLTIADDGSLDTTIEWSHDWKWRWTSLITWTVPEDAEGAYRISYVGRTTATTEPFTVAPARSGQ